MPNLRHKRVRELLKRELNEIFRREFPVELGLISVSEVGVSNDLHSATVFVSSIGDVKGQHKAFRAVRKAAGKIQGQLGQAVEWLGRERRLAQRWFAPPEFPKGRRADATAVHR